MPKTKEGLVQRFKKYIREFGDVLATDGSVLFCRACNKVINRSFKKFSITQHFQTHYHNEAVQKYYDNRKTQVQSIHSNPTQTNNNQTNFTNINNNHINTTNDNFQITPIVSHRKINLTLKQKINNYIREFGDILTTDGTILYCRACNKEITRAFKKYSVTQHFNTQTHIEAFKRYVDSGQELIVSDQMPIKTELSDNYVDNSENTFVIQQLSHNNMRSDSCNVLDNDQLNSNVIERDIKSQQQIILLLETIKDKVKLLLIDCKCDHNPSLKSEVKQLINEYECNYCDLNKQIADSHNESSEQQLNCSKDNIKKEFVFGNELLASKATRLEPIVQNSSFIIAQNSPKLESQSYLNKVQTKKLKPFRCNKCGKCFSSKREVKSHIIIFHRIYHNKFSINSSNQLTKNNKLKCDWPQCTFQTKYNFEMKIHRISIHHNSAQKLSENSQKPITEDNKEVQVKQSKCQSSECGKQSTEENSVKDTSEHEMADKKIVDKPFDCLWPECGKQFFTANRLKLHLMVHKGERPLFKCKFWPKCQNTFPEKCDLISHLVTYHKPDQ